MMSATRRVLDEASPASDTLASVAAFLDREESISVVGAEPLSGGRSAETVRLRLADRDGGRSAAVLHLQPHTGPHAGITSVARQFELLRSLEGTDVPAPPALWSGTTANGTDFMITGWAAGAVPNPWRAEGQAFLAHAVEDPAGLLADDFVRVLVAIHAVPVDDLPASAHPGPGEPRSPALRELARWSPGLDASTRFARDPVLTYARRWLIADEPSAGEPALVHGDYRIGNLVVAKDRIAAVLDWELARVGDPMLDIGTICAPPLRTSGLAVGLWDPAAFVARYAEFSGRSVSEHALSYYRVMATFKVACVWVNASAESAAGAADLSSLRAGFSVLELRRMLASTLDLPEPETAAREPSVDGLAPAFEVLRTALRDDVLPAVGEAAAREVTLAVRSVLRGLGGVTARAEEERFERVLDAALAELAASVPGVDDRPKLTATERLTLAVEAAFERFGAAVHTDPRTGKLRELVGWVAHRSMGMWP